MIIIFNARWCDARSARLPPLRQPQRPGGTPPATVADMRAQICELTGLPSEEVGDDTDLLTLGMDSIFVIRMAALMRRYGVRVGYRDLAEAPTPAAWWALARQGSEQPGPTGPRPSADVDPDAPFPLAVMQHAFWVGRDPAQDLGGVAAHLYTELDAPGPDGVDPRRLEGAVRHLVRRHGMLRVVIGADGTQRITEEGHWPGLTVHDLRGLSDDETDARLAEIRSGLSHRIMDIGAGEVFDVQLTLLGSGATRLHVNLDMVAADAFSLRTLLADLLHHYELSEQPLPEISYGYPHYLADRAQVRHERREEARQWWLDRLDDLPGAPELPVRSDRGARPRSPGATDCSPPRRSRPCASVPAPGDSPPPSLWPPPSPRSSAPGAPPTASSSTCRSSTANRCTRTSTA